MSEHLDELRRQYPGQLILKPEDVAKAIGLERQTVYNQHSLGTLPIRPRPRARHWGCSITDIARYLDSGGIPQPYIKEDEKKPRKGRKISVRQAVKYHAFWDEVVSIMRKNDRDELEELITKPLPPYPYKYP